MQQICSINLHYFICIKIIQLYKNYTGGLVDQIICLTATPPNTYSFGFFKKAKKTQTAHHNDASQKYFLTLMLVFAIIHIWQRIKYLQE